MPTYDIDVLSTDSPAHDVRHAPSARDTAGRSVGDWARAMHAAPDTEAVSRSVLDACLALLPGASAAGIATSEQGRHRGAHSCAEVAELDEFQQATKNGPCVGPSASDGVVRCDDLATESRWPLFAPAAVARGYRSLLGYRLFVADIRLGTLTVFGTAAGPFDDTTADDGALIAATAAVALNAKRLETNLRIAVESRDVIGQAKGIIMERFKLSADHAFQILVAISQHQHRKVRDVAEELAATGDLPDLP